MIHGQCLCGSVRFSFTDYKEGISVCHCSICRRSSGTAHAATIIAMAEGFNWESGKSKLKTYKSPTGRTKTFCTECGSHVPDAEPIEGIFGAPVYPVPVGTLEDDSSFFVCEHIFVGSKAQWEVIGGDAPQFDEMD